MYRKNLFLCYYFCLGVLALFGSCDESENASNGGNTGHNGSLSYAWSSIQNADTMTLFCIQSLIYKDKHGENTIYPVASVKIWPKYPTRSYQIGKNPTPIYLQSTMKSGYSGINPRYRTITQEISMDDGQIFMAEIQSEIHSYSRYGREFFYPYIELQALVFTKAIVQHTDDMSTAYISFRVPWTISNNTSFGNQEITLSYKKQASSQIDKLLHTSFAQQVEWYTDNSFVLAVEKTETWEKSGQKITSHYSPPLNFNIVGSDNKSINVSDFDFKGIVQSSSSNWKKSHSDGWQISQRDVRQTVRFSNGIEYFDDTFDYPVYDVCLQWEGQTFNFDLSVAINVAYQINILSSIKARNLSTANVLLANRHFSAEVASELIKAVPDIADTETIPDNGLPYGKIIGFAVSAVFDPAALTNHSEITKKCVLIHYETGYQWGICDYNQSFPKEFTFVRHNYNAFNSVAKETPTAEFRLAQAVDMPTAIFWYDAQNHQINGIDALTCKIKGWKNIVDGHYVSAISSYQAQYLSSYLLKLSSPDGQSMTFASRPY